MVNLYLLTSRTCRMRLIKTLGYWHQEPIVLVCDDRIDIEQVKEALDIWKAVDYKPPRKDTDALACEGSTMGSSPFEYRMTCLFSCRKNPHTTHLDHPQVYSADINIRAGRKRHRLDYPELGHAFGWGHSKRQHHVARIAVISNPDYSQSSRMDRTSGIQRVFETQRTIGRTRPQRWLKDLLSQNN